MPTKRLYTRKPMFKDAHVIRVDYPFGNLSQLSGLSGNEKDYKDLLKKLRNEINGTWGHTDLTITRTSNYDKRNYEAGLVERAYLIFKDEADILQIRLKYDKDFKSASMWPSDLLFTIHEFDYGE